jgi:threonine dehydratase
MIAGIEDVLRARVRIAGSVHHTPLVRSDWLTEASGGPVLLKLESLQVTRSFKARGALNALLVLAERCRADGTPAEVVTASAGNHGRAVAWAAARTGVHAVVFTPRHAPRAKLDAIRQLGADLRAEADDYDESERLARAFAGQTGRTFLSAYSHPDVIAAIGSIALEIVEDCPAVTRIVVPVGGGGLLAGMAAAVRTAKPGIEMVGVEVEASHAFASSLAAGHIVQVEVGETIADGLAGNMDPENLAFPIIQALGPTMTTVAEADVRNAVSELARREALVVEGAGAAGPAALASGGLSGRGQVTVVVVSGGNIDMERLVEVLGLPPTA